MKEVVFQVKKIILSLLVNFQRKILRFTFHQTLSIESSFNVPIVLNNRNRLTYLKQMIDWLMNAGYKNIYVLDNASQYPPLLEYYKNCPAKVIFLNENVGYKALWQTDLFKTIKKGYYVYSDSDLIPTERCPKQIIYQLYLVLLKYKIEKCGPALKYDDLPNYYARKEAVIKLEQNYWLNKISEDIYDAPIDTTFALYKPFAEGDAEECKAYRIAGDLTFIHLPWYENSENLDAEAKYYKENVSSSSYWYNKK